jgi:hypothetical protein
MENAWALFANGILNGLNGFIQGKQQSQDRQRQQVRDDEDRADRTADRQRQRERDAEERREREAASLERRAAVDPDNAQKYYTMADTVRRDAGSVGSVNAPAQRFEVGSASAEPTDALPGPSSTWNANDLLQRVAARRAAPEGAPVGGTPRDLLLRVAGERLSLDRPASGLDTSLRTGWTVPEQVALPSPGRNPEQIALDRAVRDGNVQALDSLLRAYPNLVKRFNLPAVRESLLRGQPIPETENPLAKGADLGPSQDQINHEQNLGLIQARGVSAAQSASLRERAKAGDQWADAYDKKLTLYMASSTMPFEEAHRRAFEETVRSRGTAPYAFDAQGNLPAAGAAPPTSAPAGVPMPPTSAPGALASEFFAAQGSTPPPASDVEADLSRLLERTRPAGFSPPGVTPGLQPDGWSSALPPGIAEQLLQRTAATPGPTPIITEPQGPATSGPVPELRDVLSRLRVSTPAPSAPGASAPLVQTTGQLAAEKAAAGIRQGDTRLQQGDRRLDQGAQALDQRDRTLANQERNVTSLIQSRTDAAKMAEARRVDTQNYRNALVNLRKEANAQQGQKGASEARIAATALLGSYARERAQAVSRMNQIKQNAERAGGFYEQAQKDELAALETRVSGLDTMQGGLRQHLQSYVNPATPGKPAASPGSSGVSAKRSRVEIPGLPTDYKAPSGVAVNRELFQAVRNFVKQGQESKVRAFFKQSGYPDAATEAYLQAVR